MDMADTELEGDELTAALEEKAVEHGITARRWSSLSASRCC